MLNQRKDRKKLLDLSQINSFHIDLRSITVEKIIQILHKSPKDRNLKDYSILYSYILYISKLTDKFILDKIDNSAHEKIILLSLPSAKLKIILNSNTIIYNPDNDANYLYIILRGTAKILQLEKIKCEMNSYNYYKLLINYRNNNEKYLLAKTIEENYSFFPIDINDIPNLEKILLKLYIYEHDENDTDYLDKLLKKVGLNYSDFGLKYSYKEAIELKNKEIESLNKKLIKEGREYECKKLIQYDNKEAKQYLEEQENIIFPYLDTIPFETCQKYLFFRNNSEMLVFFYKFKEDKHLRNNDYFGDFLYGKYIHCVESLQEDLYLLMIKNTVFKEFTKNLKSNVTVNQINFLVENFFFHNIKKIIFERYYLNLFEIEHYKLGQKICNENDLVENIYFIKEGKVKLYTNKSVLEIHMLINVINELVKQKKIDANINDKEKDTCNFFNNNLDNNNNQKKFDVKEYYDELDNNIENMQKEINTKQKRHLITYQENQCLGFESFYYKLKYLYTAIVNSNKAEIYKISIERLNKILHDKNEKTYLDFSKQAENTINFLKQRFIKLNNFMLKFYDKKKTIETENSISFNNSNDIDINNIIFNEENKNINERNKRLVPIKKIVSGKLPQRLIKRMKNCKKINNIKQNNIKSNSINITKKLPDIFNIDKTKLIQNESDIKMVEENNNNKHSSKNNSFFDNIIKKNKILIKPIKRNILNKIKLINIRKPQKDFFELTNLLPPFKSFNDNSFNNSNNDSNNIIDSSLICKSNSYKKNNIIIKKINNNKNNSLNFKNDKPYSFSPRIKSINEIEFKDINFSFINQINKKKLINEKLQDFIKIRNKLMINKNQIYRKQKEKLKQKFNIFYKD